MTKTIYLDMDGTFVDLYSQEKWLEKLHAQNRRVYVDAPSMYNVFMLKRLMKELKKQGWRLEIISWGARHSSAAYLESTKRQKINWLRYYGLKELFDKIHIIPYGTNKTDYMQNKGLLIDDSPEVVKQVKNTGKHAIITKNYNLLQIFWTILKYYQRKCYFSLKIGGRLAATRKEKKIF